MKWLEPKRLRADISVHCGCGSIDCVVTPFSYYVEKKEGCGKYYSTNSSMCVCLCVFKKKNLNASKPSNLYNTSCGGVEGLINVLV